MRIDEIAADWDRVKVSLGPGLRPHSSAQAAKPPNPEIHRNPRNLMKYSDLHGNQTKSSQLGSSKGFFKGRTPRAIESPSRRIIES